MVIYSDGKAVFVKSEIVRLRIVTVSGQLVHDNTVWYLSSGVKILPVRLEKGLYIILLINNGFNIVEKVRID